MAGQAVRALAWVLVGVLLMGAAVWFAMPSLLLVQHKSPRDYEATVAALQQAIADKPDWKVPSVSDFQKTISETGFGPIDRVGSVALCNPRLGSPLNRSKLMRWITLMPALTILVPWASFRPGFGPMRTAWTIWSGYAGPPVSSARSAATLEAGGWVMVGSCAPGAEAVRR